MDTTFRIIITAVLAGILGSLITVDNSQADAAAETASPAPEALAFDNATPEQIELVSAAIETFADAELELPPLVIRFDSTGEQCHGHGGLFHPATPATITICADSRPVVLHELAHAWEWSTLDDSARDEFMKAYGLETWNSKDADWGDRGVEKFAQTVEIGFVLLSGSENPVVIDRLCSFEQITGQDHPALTAADCAA